MRVENATRKINNRTGLEPDDGEEQNDDAPD